MSVAPRLGVRHGIAIVDAVDLGRLEQDLGVDLDRAQRGRGVGREVRVAGARPRRSTTRPFSRWRIARRRMYGSAISFMAIAVITRVGTPARSSASCERQAVHDRRQHADVVAGRAVHAPRRRRQPAEDVAAADDDPDLDAERVDLADLAGDERAERRVDAVLAVAEQGLAGQLEQDAPIAQRRRVGRRQRAGVGHSSSPSA